MASTFRIRPLTPKLINAAALFAFNIKRMSSQAAEATTCLRPASPIFGNASTSVEVAVRGSELTGGSKSTTRRVENQQF
jgi:hypothetical protein